MKSYKMVFSDIDGTLLDSNHKITKRTKKKISSIVKEGTPFVLVSARMPIAIEPIQNELNIDSPIIAYSGGLILDSDRNIMSNLGIEKEQVLEVKAFISKNFKDVCNCVYSYDNWIVDDIKNPWVIQESYITGINAIDINLETYLSKNNIVHKIMCMGEASQIQDVYETVSSKFENLTIYKSKDTYLEIMNKKASKSGAIEIICEKYNVDSNEVIAFGDNYNDLDMIKYVGFGVAMGNAPQDIKKHANHVALDNDNEGLCKVLEEIYA